MKKILALACVLLAGLGAAVQAQMLSREPLDRIVAVAEDEVILQSELDRAVANVLAQYRNRPQQLPPREVLESLILRRRQVQRAQSTGIRVSDTDVDQAMQRVAENNKMTVAQLRA